MHLPHLSRSKRGLLTLGLLKMQLVAPLLLFAGSLMVLSASGCSDQGDARACRHWDEGNSDDELFLTPLILAGRLDEAKSLSKVRDLPTDLEFPSYAGFITVNPEFNSNLFFWFVPSLTAPRNAPVVLWLQGGPGTTSMLGFFSEHGPYRVSSNGTMAEFRRETWAVRYSMLYVDQPVGTGFSFTDNEAGYARNQTDVGRDILEFLQQFFTLFNNLERNEFYITGESYGGKYVPTVGATIHQNAHLMRVKINFKGIAYGNGLTDPVNMLGFGEFLYGIGLIDHLAADYMTQVTGEVTEHIRSGRTGLALQIMDSLFIGMATKDTFFKNATGFEYYYNYLHDKAPRGLWDYKQFVPRSEVRRALHVGQRNFSTTRDAVWSHFVEDFMRSAVPQLTVLLESGYRVLVYSGQLDIAVPTTQTEHFLAQMSWSRADRWAHAPQRQWRSVDGQKLYGYTKSVDNLYLAVVRNSGHMVPYDVPRAALDMITAFVDGTAPFEIQL